jgi:hypothetical protein
MLELGHKFSKSHQRQLTELELVRHSTMRDSNELVGSDRSVPLQNLSLFDQGDPCLVAADTLHLLILLLHQILP